MRCPDHIGDLCVEVGVHDPGVRVRPPQVREAPLQQSVVVAGEVVVIPEAPVVVVVSGVGGAKEGEVGGEAADGQQPGPTTSTAPLLMIVSRPPMSLVTTLGT